MGGRGAPRVHGGSLQGLTQSYLYQALTRLRLANSARLLACRKRNTPPRLPCVVPCSHATPDPTTCSCCPFRTPQLYLTQPQPDPRLWQRLVGLLACGVPHPDLTANHLVDQSRLPLAEAAARIRRTARIARCHPDAGMDPIAPPPPPPAPDAAAPPEAESADHAAQVGSGPEAPAVLSADAVQPYDPRVGRRAGILLSEDEEDTMLLHRLCEAEDLLDSVVHVALELSAGETPLLRRAMATCLSSSHVLLGDALVAMLAPALRLDLSTAAAELRHRTNRDRVITLGVDLADKARVYASHRPEFTLTKVRGGLNRQPSMGALKALSRMAGATVTVEAGVVSVGTLGPQGSTVGQQRSSGSVGGASMKGEKSEAEVGLGERSEGQEEDDEEEDDQDALRVQRRQQAMKDAEAAIAAAAAASAGGAAPEPSSAESPDRRGKMSRGMSMSKSALIRMEMATGRSLAGSPVPGSGQGGSLPSTPGTGARNSRLGTPNRGEGTYTGGNGWINMLRRDVPITPPRSSLASAGQGQGGRGKSPDKGAAKKSIGFADSGEPMTAKAAIALLGSAEAPSTPSRGRNKRASNRAHNASGTGMRESATSALAIVAPTMGGMEEEHEEEAGEGAGEQEQEEGTGEEADKAQGPPQLVDRFVHLSPPGFLSAGKMLNPKVRPGTKCGFIALLLAL